MQAPDLGGRLDELMQWVAAVTGALHTLKVPVLSAAAAQLPGALQVAVYPDSAGRDTAVALVQWAAPELAVVVRPDQQPTYELYLEGDQRVVIVCGRPNRDFNEDADAGWLSDAERRRIEARLVDIVDKLLRGDPEWHPTAPSAETDLVDAYFTDYHGGDSRAEVAALIDEPPVRMRLYEAGREREVEHTAAWTRDAERIARALLEGSDGEQLRTGTKPNRIVIIQRHLQVGDAYCATKSAAEPIDNAIRQLKRHR